jgi:hypothetical protein
MMGREQAPPFRLSVLRAIGEVAVGPPGSAGFVGLGSADLLMSHIVIVNQK